MEHLPLLEGPNVCDFHQRFIRDPGRLNSGANRNSSLIRNCCPGFESLDRRTCASKMDFLNPFKDSDNFSLALICLAVLLIAVAVLSMFIAYRYYYRYRIGRKPGILTEEDMDGHEETFVIGFTMTTTQTDDNPYKPPIVSR